MKKMFLLIGVCICITQAMGQKLITEMLYGKIILQTMEAGDIFLDGKPLGKVKEGSRNIISEVVVGKHTLEFIFLNKEKNVYTFVVNENESYTIEIKPTAPIYKSKLKLGIILSKNGLDDNSINASTWKGIAKFTNSNKMEQGKDYFLVRPKSEKEYSQGIVELIDKKATAIIAPGYYLEGQVLEAAEKNKSIHFIILDSTVSYPNVTSAIFADHEGSYIVGLISAMVCKRDGQSTVGFIGGMKLPAIERYLAGYSQGVKAIDPAINIIVRYSNTLEDVSRVGLLAKQVYDEGAYIIYHVTGESGKGIIEEAISRNENGNQCWVVGSGVDEYTKGIYSNGSVVLTSMIKRYDLVIESLLQMEINDTLEHGKIYNYSINQDALGIPINNPNLDSDILNIISQHLKKIKNKEISISEYIQEE